MRHLTRLLFYGRSGKSYGVLQLFYHYNGEIWEEGEPMLMLFLNYVEVIQVKLSN